MLWGLLLSRTRAAFRRTPEAGLFWGMWRGFSSGWWEYEVLHPSCVRPAMVLPVSRGVLSSTCFFTGTQLSVLSLRLKGNPQGTSRKFSVQLLLLPSAQLAWSLQILNSVSSTQGGCRDLFGFPLSMLRPGDWALSEGSPFISLLWGSLPSTACCPVAKKKHCYIYFVHYVLVFPGYDSFLVKSEHPILPHYSPNHEVKVLLTSRDNAWHTAGSRASSAECLNEQLASLT